MKLITEEIQDVEFLTEVNKDTGKKEHFIEGIFMMAETKNKNGRVYPLPILSKEVHRYNEQYVAKNRAFGELGHPDSPQINLPLVSHIIENLKPEGNNFVGRAKILDTPNGKIVKSLLDGGASLGVSTRGVGSLKPVNGYQLVQDDFHLATAADIVADPSAPEAFVQGIREGAEWILTNRGWTSVNSEQARDRLLKASKSEIEEVALDIFEDFFSKL
jgi:hypothetical protein